MREVDRAEVIKRSKAVVVEDPDKLEQIEKNFVTAKPIIDELIGIGYRVETLADLRHRGKPWKSALAQVRNAKINERMRHPPWFLLHLQKACVTTLSPDGKGGVRPETTCS